jgi:hypothetical protein
MSRPEAEVAEERSAVVFTLLGGPLVRETVLSDESIAYEVVHTTDDGLRIVFACTDRAHAIRLRTELGACAWDEVES